MQKNYPPVKLNETLRFIDQYRVSSTISLAANLTQIAEVKHLSNKTNPNINAIGVNEDYLGIKNLNLSRGRNFSSFEIDNGKQVVIIGNSVYNVLFKNNEDPINQKISFSGTQFKVIGTLEEKGQSLEDNYDNMVFIPIRLANQMAKGQGLNYELTVSIVDPTQLEYAMGEATGVMRAIRRDKAGRENSFELESSEALKERTAKIIGYFRIGGLVIGFITLLGASIALMNIMLVSVTERTREIGVRKALGRNSVAYTATVCDRSNCGLSVRRNFRNHSWIVVGNFFGGFLGSDSYFIPWLWILVGFIVCIFVGLISGFYPAHKASKLDPIESLRFE